MPRLFRSIVRLLPVLLTVALLPAPHVAAADPPVIDQPVEGKQLVLRRNGSGRGKLSFAGGTPGEIAFPPFLEQGAVVELFSPAEPAGVRFELPATGWSMERQFVVRFMNRRAPNDLSPLSNAVLEQQRYLKVSGKVPGLALDVPQGRVGIRITAGTTRWCALFTEVSAIADVPGRFAARRAPADVVTDCRADSLGGIGSPSGAFVEP
ncbi:MAG TPA: hypothetical protein VGR62_02505 [Candidatus Binatia bacterium]|nr:hypothetical protein [Candidatus Binatia bacterium]